MSAKVRQQRRGRAIGQSDAKAAWTMPQSTLRNQEGLSGYALDREQSGKLHGKSRVNRRLDLPFQRAFVTVPGVIR
jgi:hypothetical protein